MQVSVTSFNILSSLAVFYGDVHCVRFIWGPVADLVSLLLEGLTANPVLGGSCDPARDAGESCILC